MYARNLQGFCTQMRQNTSKCDIFGLFFSKKALKTSGEAVDCRLGNGLNVSDLIDLER